MIGGAAVETLVTVNKREVTALSLSVSAHSDGVAIRACLCCFAEFYCPVQTKWRANENELVVTLLSL